MVKRSPESSYPKKKKKERVHNHRRIHLHDIYQHLKIKN